VSDFVYRVFLALAFEELVREVEDDAILFVMGVTVSVDDAWGYDDDGWDREFESHDSLIGWRVLSDVPEFNPPYSIDKGE